MLVFVVVDGLRSRRNFLLFVDYGMSIQVFGSNGVFFLNTIIRCNETAF